MSNNNQTFYKFGDFRLDVAERLLLRDGESVSLSPKMFEVLAVLVERGGHLVEKDELLHLVWEDTFVEESNIARIVHSLRKILGENGERKFIETVSKKGYRFVAEVEKIDDSMPNQNGFSVQTEYALPKNNGNYFLQNGDDLIEPIERNGASNLETIEEFLPEKNLNKEIPVELSSKRNYTYFFLGAIAVFAIAAFGTRFYKNAPTANGDNLQHKSIAVLPIKPIDVENRDLIYELGIADSLINKLSPVKGLTVRPLSATRKYSDIEQDAIVAGKEQQVDYILASNYQITDGKIRVTSQLINVQTGAIEETLRSDKDNADKLLMQDAIANDFGNTLLKQLGKTGNTQTAKRGTDNEEAYRLYLKAVYIFEDWNEPEFGKAIENLEQAVKLDPNYAQAYVRLAYAYQTYQFSPRADIAPENEYYLKPKKAIEKALALDENSADAHAVLGFIKSGYERDFAGAEKEYQRAIELDSRSGMAHGLYVSFLMIFGRFDEALVEEKKAIEIDPTDAVNYIAYGMILYHARRYSEASAYFKKMLEKYGGDYFPYNWLWIVNDAQGNEAEAYKWFIKDQTHSKTDAERIRQFQKAYKQSGWNGILREKIRQDEQILITDKNPFYLYEIACFSAKLGDKEKAFEYLDKSYEQQRSTLNFIKVDPSLDSLHDDPRFDELVKRVGLN